MAEDEKPERSNPEPSPAARKLAERYGMAPEAIERIMATAKPASQAELPPVPATPPTPIEQAARSIPAPAPPKQPKVNGGLIAAVATVVIIGLGIAFSFQKGCFRQRHEATVTDRSDTIPALLKQQADSASTPPVPATQVSPNDVPPEALTAPQESPPGTTGPTPPKSILGREQANAGTRSSGNDRSYSTSSSLDAEEKLAELRASGHTHARLRTVVRHGVKTHIVTP